MRTFSLIARIVLSSGSHAGSLGPIACVSTIPLRLYPWIRPEMVDLRTNPEYMRVDFIEKDLSKNNVKLLRDAQYKGILKMDQDKMVRVFYNIASNARDAMPQGGTLEVSTAPVEGYVKIEFKDSGTGMPEEVKKKIFEPFMTYGKKHGTGLGMSIVKKVIDDHKGKIEIDSEMGKGTTIRILLPL